MWHHYCHQLHRNSQKREVKLSLYIWFLNISFLVTGCMYLHNETVSPEFMTSRWLGKPVDEIGVLLVATNYGGISATENNEYTVLRTAFLRIEDRSFVKKFYEQCRQQHLISDPRIYCLLPPRTFIFLDKKDHPVVALMYWYLARPQNNRFMICGVREDKLGFHIDNPRVMIKWTIDPETGKTNGVFYNSFFLENIDKQFEKILKKTGRTLTSIR